MVTTREGRRKKTHTSCPKLGIGSAQSRSQSRPTDAGSTNRSSCSHGFSCLFPDNHLILTRTNGLRAFSTSSNRMSSGEMPPCMQKNFPSMSAVRGRAWNERIQASYTVAEYLCRPVIIEANENISVRESLINWRVRGGKGGGDEHSRLKVKYSVRCLHS